MEIPTIGGMMVPTITAREIPTRHGSVLTTAKVRITPPATQCLHMALASMRQDMSEAPAEARKSSICGLFSIAIVGSEPILQKVIFKWLYFLRLRSYSELWISLELNKMSEGRSLRRLLLLQQF